MSQVIKINHPLKRYEKQIINIESGMTLADIRKMPEITNTLGVDNDIAVSVNGEIIPFESWGNRRIQENDFVLLVPWVAKGDDEKSIMNIVIMVAVMYAAPRLLGAGGLGLTGITYAAAYVGVAVGTAMIVSALSPRPSQPSLAFDESELSQSFGWNPATIQRQGIPRPRWYGLNKMYGNVTQAYTEITGAVTNIQRLYALIDLGVGPFREVMVESTFKLNGQAAANFDDVLHETRRGLLRQTYISYFEKTKVEFATAGLPILIKNGSPKIYETKNADYDDIEIDLAFPSGLYDATGSPISNHTVNITIEVKKTTASSWNTLVTEDITDDTASKVIRSYTTSGIITIDRGSKYQVRVTKNTAEKDSVLWGDDLFLDRIREVTDEQFTYPRAALVGIRVLATEQLSGAIGFSCLSRGLYVVDYTDSASPIIYSTNPGLILADILTQPIYSGKHSPWHDLNLMLNFNGADAATSTIDDSERGHVINFTGTAQLDTAEKKFGTASLLLDGNSDDVNIDNDEESFNVCENIVEDWTVDFFIKFADHVDTETLITQYEDNDNRWLLLHIHGSGLVFRNYIAGVQKIDISGVGEITDTDWHHIAVCKVGDEYGLYLDNVQVGYDSMVVGDIDTYDGSLFVGQKGDDSLWFQGHIDHLRIVKTNIFSAIPNVGLTDRITNLHLELGFSGLKLLLHLDGVDATTSTVDGSEHNHPITFVGTAQLDTAQKKFGVSSLLLDGNSDWLTVPDSSSWDICANVTDDWTIDLFIKMADHTGTEFLVTQFEDADNRWYLLHADGIGFYFRNRVGGNQRININAVGEITDTNWHHVAICKVGADIGLYLDGSQVGYDLMVVGDVDIYDGDLYIGQLGNGTNLFEGHLDEIRIVNKNVFNATPNDTPDDTITVPDIVEYANPGNSFVVERFDGYDSSELDLPAFEDLVDWCDDAEVNPVNYTISDISLATNAVITTTSKHGRAIGDTVLFRGVDNNGMVELIDETTANVIKVTDDNTFTVDLDTRGYTAFEVVEKVIYNFDHPNGSHYAMDESLFGNNITSSGFVGSTIISTASNKFGTASLYQSSVISNAEITLEQSGNLDICANVTDDWTISCFVRLVDHASWDALVANVQDSDNYWVFDHGDGTGLQFSNVVAGGNKIVTSAVGGEIVDNNWHHVAVCKVGDNIGIYLDGNQVGYDLMIGGDIATYGDDLHLQGIHIPPAWLESMDDGGIDALIISKSNIFSAAPVVGLTDTITEPVVAPSSSETPTVEEYKPRFDFNGGFDTETTMWDAALKVCEICRCVPYFKGSKISVAIDRAGDAVFAYTSGNINKDSFRQIFIPTSERASQIEVHYRDKNQDYQRQPFTLMNPDIGNPTAKARLDLFGITDEELAERIANNMLLKNQHIKTICRFLADIDSIASEIGDPILAPIDATKYGQVGDGRILSATNSGDAVVTVLGTFTWNDPDWDSPGLTAYRLMVKTADDVIETKSITDILENEVGTQTEITVNGTFTILPVKGDLWAAGEEDYEIKKYRVINLRQSDKQKVEVTAIEYVDAVYADD